MTLTVVGIGSNINPEENIKKAKKILFSENNVLKESIFIQTIPVGSTGQEDFINGALLISVYSPFEDFQNYLKSVEIRIGRVRTEDKFAPRVIDLDILVWDGKIVDDDFYDRDFLQKITFDVLPDFKF